MAPTYASFLSWVSASARNTASWRIKPGPGMDAAACDYASCRRAIDAGVPTADLLANLPARVQPRAPDFDAAAIVNAVLRDRGAEAEAPAAIHHRPTCTAIRGVRMYTGRPRTIDLDVGGHPLTCLASALKSRNEFKRECLDSLGLMPVLPSRADEWDDVVAAVLGEAEQIEEPHEASVDGHELATIGVMLRQLQMGDCLSDLNAGKWVEHDGHRVLRQFAVTQQFQSRLPGLQPASLAKHLRACGWSPTHVRIDSEPVRVWRQDSALPPDEIGPTAALAAAGQARQAKMRQPMEERHLGFFDEETH